jgi:hypothetical protein
MKRLEIDSASHPLGLRSERGSIMVIFAAFSLVIILFCIGIAIQKPTDDANATKLQHALSVAVSEAMPALSRPEDAVVSAYTTTVRIMNNEYSAGQVGFFSRGVKDFYAWIPSLGPGIDALTPPGLNHFKRYYCANNTCSACPPSGGCGAASASDVNRQLDIARRVFDPEQGGSQVDDHYNGMMLYARSNPFRYFGFVPNKTQELVAASVLSKGLAYVLIDPAFSMQENYSYLFGNENPDPSSKDRVISGPDNQWPVVVDRHDAGSPYGIGSAWEYPDNPGLMQSTPTDGVDFENFEVYRFYSSLCFNLPWDYYRGAVVDFLDHVGLQSAYSNTTFVGLTGPGPSPAPGVVPIHPISPLTNPVEHDTSLPTVDSLFTPKTEAFTGFINPLNLAKDANYGPDDTLGGGDDIGSGYNMPELCMCRGLINDSASSDSPFTLNPDSATPSLTGSDTVFNHKSEEKRERSNTGSNWCSDSNDILDSNLVNLSLARQGLHGGESARNLVAQMGIRVNDLRLDRLETATDGENWTRGSDPITENAAPTDGLDAMATGWRYLPDSIRDACSTLVSARTNYQSNPANAELRPLEEDSQSLILFGFGAWSRGAEQYFAGLPGGLAKNEDDMRDDLVDAVADCVCAKNIRVIMSFLPLNTYDRRTVQILANALNPYRNFSNSQCTGAPPPPAPPGCISTNDPRLNIFIVDYANEFFREAGTLDPIVDESQIKANAARFFYENVPIAIQRLIPRFTFQL